METERNPYDIAEQIVCVRREIYSVAELYRGAGKPRSCALRRMAI